MVSCRRTAFRMTSRLSTERSISKESANSATPVISAMRDCWIATSTGDSRGSISAALAASINANAASGFSAIGDDSNFVIVNRDGDAFTATYAVVPSPETTDGDLSADAATATTDALTLIGTPVEGEIWSITLSGAAAVSIGVLAISFGSVWAPGALQFVAGNAYLRALETFVPFLPIVLILVGARALVRSRR